MAAQVRLPDPPADYSQDQQRQLVRQLNAYFQADTSEDGQTPAFGQVSLPFTASIALNAAQANIFNIGPLTGNITTFSLIPGVLNQNPDAGLVVYVFFLQDGTGSRTVAFPTGTGNNQFIWTNGVVGTLSTTAGTLDLLTCVYRINPALTNVGNWYVTLENGVPGVGTFSSLTVAGASALNGGTTTTTLTASGAAALNGGTSTTTLTESTGAAWSTYTPTITATAGTITTVSGTMRYRQLGKTVFFNLKVTITTVGTGSGGVVSTLPFTSDTTIARQMSCGRADALSGKMLQARALGTTLQILAYDNTFPAASGEVLYVSGVYESV